MKTLLTVLFTILVFVAVYCGIVWLFMVLWNFIAAGLFGAPTLNFLTALGLTLLLSIIGSFFKNSNNK